jgi:hypothetical protein
MWLPIAIVLLAVFVFALALAIQTVVTGRIEQHRGGGAR